MANKAARMNVKATRAKRRLLEFTFGAYSECIAAFRNFNDIGMIYVPLGICVGKSCPTPGLQKIKRDGFLENVARPKR